MAWWVLKSKIEHLMVCFVHGLTPFTPVIPSLPSVYVPRVVVHHLGSHQRLQLFEVFLFNAMLPPIAGYFIKILGYVM